MCFLGKTLLVFALLCSVFQGQICLLLQVFLDFLVYQSSAIAATTHSFDVHLSYLGPLSCVLTSGDPSGLSRGSGCSLWQLKGKYSFLPQYLPFSCHRLQPLPMLSPEGTPGVRTQDTGPRELRCISKECVYGTWGIWFYLINNHLLTFRLCALCCKSSI